MKTIATLLLVLFIGVTAQAKAMSNEVQVATVEMGIVMDIEIAQDLNLENTTSVARLYRRKNAMVKKALTFTTKRDRKKMA